MLHSPFGIGPWPSREAMTAWCLLNGANIKVVQERLGHASGAHHALHLLAPAPDNSARGDQ